MGYLKSVVAIPSSIKSLCIERAVKLAGNDTSSANKMLFCSIGAAEAGMRIDDDHSFDRKGKDDEDDDAEEIRDEGEEEMPGKAAEAFSRVGALGTARPPSYRFGSWRMRRRRG